MLKNLGPWIAFGLIIFLLTIIVEALITRATPRSSIVETRNEHLIWSSPGCKVYQLVIKNEWGTYVLFITAPALEQTPIRQEAYPTCRVTY